MVVHASIPVAPLDGASVDAVVDPEGFATCPACHVVDATMTNAAVAAGRDWRCRRCGQQWGMRRLATVAAYNAWESARETTRNRAVPRAL